MTGRVPNRRRNFLVDTQIQGRFVLFLIFFLIGYNILTGLLHKLAAQMDFAVFVPIYLAVMALYIGLVGIFYSHRLAGPLYKISQTLGEIARGDLFLNIFCRRENDQIIKDISASINMTINELRESIRGIEAASSALSQETEGLRDKMLCRSNEFPEVIHHLDVIREKEKELQELVKRYKVR